jgi:hypothetical protein
MLRSFYLLAICLIIAACTAGSVASLADDRARKPVPKATIKLTTIPIKSGFKISDPSISASVGSLDYDKLVAKFDNSPSYYCNQKDITAIDRVMNRSTCNGPSTNYGIRFVISFDATSSEEICFRIGGDFGLGGSMIVNKEVKVRDTGDYWWAGNWGNTARYTSCFTPVQGANQIEFIGFEGCCDGWSAMQVKPARGEWTGMTTEAMAMAATEKDGICYVSGDPHITNFKGRRFDDYTFGDVVIYQNQDIQVIGHNGQSHSWGKRAAIQGITVKVGTQSSTFRIDKFCKVHHTSNGVDLQLSSSGTTGYFTWGTTDEEFKMSARALCGRAATSATTYGNNRLRVKLVVPGSKIKGSFGYCRVPDEEIGTKYIALDEGKVFVAGGADLKLFQETLERVKKENPDDPDLWLGLAEDEIRTQVSQCYVSGDPHIEEFNGNKFSDYTEGWHLMYQDEPNQTNVIVHNLPTQLTGSMTSVQGVHMKVGTEYTDLAVSASDCSVTVNSSRGFDLVKLNDKMYKYDNEATKLKVNIGVQCSIGSYAALTVSINAPVSSAENSTGYCNVSVKDNPHRYRHLSFAQLYAAADGDKALAMQEYQLCQTEPQEDVGTWFGCAEDRLKAKVKLEGMCKNESRSSSMVRLQQAQINQDWRFAYRYVVDVSFLNADFKEASLSETGWCWNEARDGLVPLVEYHNPTWSDYYYAVGDRPVWLNTLYEKNQVVCWLSKSSPYLANTVLNQFYSVDGTVNKLAASDSIPETGVKKQKLGYIWTEGCAAIQTRR